MPSIASAQEMQAKTTPAISARIRNAEGKVISDFNPLSRLKINENENLYIANAESNTVANIDGSYSSQCITQIGATPRNANQATYEDEYATATVTINYLLSQGNITVQSGSVNITRIASNVSMYSRYLIVAQGPYTGQGDTIVEEFSGNTHAIITGFSSTEYVPSGPSHMNICRFESGILIDGTEDYFFDVEVTV
ncbi:MAG: hypothetical protein U0M72_05820 [Eggerthellaceae bacterium]